MALLGPSTYKPIMRRARVAASLATTVTCTALAACGAAAGSIGSGGNGTRGPNLALQHAQCMRTNGVPSFPDGPLTSQSAINLQSPAFRSASNACRKYLHASGHSPPVPASVRREEIAFANCMRANGVPNFPDPGANGAIQFPLGSPTPQAPAFQQAQNGPCKKYLAR